MNMDPDLLHSYTVYRILVYVSENGPCNKSDIYGNVRVSSKTVMILDALIDEGFLTETRLFRHNTKAIGITDLGMRLLEAHRGIERAMADHAVGTEGGDGSEQ